MRTKEILGALGAIILVLACCSLPLLLPLLLAVSGWALLGGVGLLLTILVVGLWWGWSRHPRKKP